MIERHEIRFVLGPNDVPRRLDANGTREPLRPGEAFFVALRVAAGALRAERLKNARSVKEAVMRVGPGGRIGIPINRRGKLGIVFQVASVAGP